MKLNRDILIITIGTLVVLGTVVLANTDFSVPAGVPSQTGVTLDDIYHKLNGTSPNIKSFNPAVGTGVANFHDLGEIYELLIPVDSEITASGTVIMGVNGVYDISNLIPENVATGTHYGTSSVGTMI
jgi:hypothetical protein